MGNAERAQKKIPLKWAWPRSREPHKFLAVRSAILATAWLLVVSGYVCYGLSCMLSFRVHVKLFYRIVSNGIMFDVLRQLFDHDTSTSHSRTHNVNLAAFTVSMT